ncbi:target of Sbf [Didymosphaeria variabile]|uniref:Target of Sbf n=1 Tax=Didymosphaeria variabile TaxID=1932322 RepID=A0A9W9C6R5_9PLEO|nr:target of Sbf [Didymosphaeria variabile]KAJ4345693.1 target of Sbf [Didymosphaeria variabile]
MPASPTKQPAAPTTVQTILSTIKETIATTIMQTIIPSNAQLGSPGTTQLTKNGPGFVCTITPTITTTIFTQGSTCPNPVPAFTQTQILPPPPYIPIPRDEESPAVTGVPTSASPTSGNPLQENDVKRDAASIWSRVAYYTSAAPAAASGFAFLANLGDPQKSGTFDYAFGNSLGYVIGDGSKVAADSTPFDGTLETSEREIAVFTDKTCDNDCEYARPNATAHYGWEGPAKAFFIEFQMDHYDNYGSDQGMLSDAPAWWFLNAAIPRILQYGNDRKNIPCSCWSTGCGEFDAFEILGRGETRAKSTIHRQGNLEGGDSNYFLRPVGRTIKFAVVFYNWNITARVLDDGFDFGAGLTQAQIDDILAYDASDNSHSLFSIGD